MSQAITKHKLKLVRALRTHQTFVVLVALLLVSLLALTQVYTLGNLPADKTYVEKETKDLKPVRFDETAIEYIKSLRDSNVAAPGTDISKDRQNPFSE